MSFMRLFLFIALGFFMSVPAAHACPQNLYDKGDFKAAEQLSESIGTADGHILAAKSALVLVRYFTPDDDRIPVIERAMAHATKALALDPDNVEARLHLAIAHGYRGRITHSPSDASKSKKLILQAMDKAPQNPWVMASYAGWNGEVVHRGGSFMASLMFGASNKNAHSYFQLAIATEPHNGPFRLGYAKMLLRTGKDKWQSLAQDHLSACVNITPHTAFEAIIHNECSQLHATLANEEALKTLLDSKRTPYPDLASLRWFAVQ